MSDAVSAMNGETFSGFAEVADIGLRGMITLRGDLGAAKIKSVVKKVTGQAVPEARQITIEGGRGVAWMSPDELLLFVPYDEVSASVSQITSGLKGFHHLAVDVSDARATFAVKGRGAREVLAKLTPADVSPDKLLPGEIRRSRVAQVAAAFWMTGDDEFELVTFRSTAEYVFNLLKNASLPGGEVDFF